MNWTYSVNASISFFETFLSMPMFINAVNLFHRGRTSIKQIRSRTPHFAQRWSVPTFLKLNIFTYAMIFHVCIIYTTMGIRHISISQTPSYLLLPVLTIRHSPDKDLEPGEALSDKHPHKPHLPHSRQRIE